MRSDTRKKLCLDSTRIWNMRMRGPQIRQSIFDIPI